MSAPQLEATCAPAASTPLAVLEISVRGQRLPAARRVHQWPLTVGRDPRCDVVLSDPHVAAQHLRVQPGDDGALRVEVLDTRNGVRHAGRHHASGARFDWLPGRALELGPLTLDLRAADTPLAPEQLWRRRSALGWLWLAAGVLALMGVSAFSVWLADDEPGQLARTLPMALMGVLAALLLWSGAWALLGKLITGHTQFWRHVAIAVAGALVVDALLQGAHALAFAFSWPLLARFDRVLYVPVLAVMLWWHLRVATHTPRRALNALVGSMAVVAIALPMALSWQQSRRVTDTLYMSDLFPPHWRLAQPESVQDFVQGAAALQPRLQVRRNDKSDEISGRVDDLD